MAKKTETKERILLRNNWQRRDEIEKRLRDAVYVANNTIIPMCEALNMAVVDADVIKWVYDKEAFREAFVKMAKRDAKAGKYMAKVIEAAANDDFTNQLKQYPYPVIMPIMTSAEERKMLSIINGVMVYDKAQLTEYTNVYLTDYAQVEAYHRIEGLCETLNAFFGDKMPVNDALNTWANIVYPTKAGFKVNPITDFRKYVKLNK